MVNWLAEHRTLILIVAATIAVVLPLILGAAFGHIPRQLLVGSALPLGAATFLLAILVQFIGSGLAPTARFVISSILGLIWMGVGIQLIWIEKRNVADGSEAARARRGISYMFIVFGLLWICVSVFRYLK